jgi:hypothetical protein
MQKKIAKNTKLAKYIFLSGALAASLMASSLALAGGPQTAAAKALAAPEGPSKIYLPVMMRPANDSVFGIQAEPFFAGAATDSVASAGTSWTRRKGLFWSSVEPTEGARNWSALAGLEQEMILASQKGLKMLLIVRSTPAWARQQSDSECGPIRADKRQAFANFMRDAVARYSAAPYNVKYWELWNEEDIQVTGNGGVQEYGCWGDVNDTYYGGGNYGEMLKVATPMIKSADASAQVLVGGLLLDCNPINPPAGKDCHPANFLEGILRAGAGPYFDGVSFHAYDYYKASLGNYSNSNWQSSWDTTGTVTIAKARFLKQVLANYGVTGKYLMNTESAILCDWCNDTYGLGDTYQATKAAYVVQVNAAAMAEGLKANVWYSLWGWHYSEMFRGTGPTYALNAFAFERSIIGNADFVRAITQYPGVLGYVFTYNGKTIWLMWGNSTTARTVALPSAPSNIYDTFGAAKTPAASLTVDQMPVYVVWNP